MFFKCPFVCKFVVVVCTLKACSKTTGLTLLNVWRNRYFCQNRWRISYLKWFAKLTPTQPPTLPKIRKVPILAQNRGPRCKLQLYHQHFVIRALEIGTGVEAGNAVDKKWSFLPSCNWFINCNKLILCADYFRSQKFFLCISKSLKIIPNRNYSNNLLFCKLFSANLAKTGFKGCRKGLIS